MRDVRKEHTFSDSVLLAFPDQEDDEEKQDDNSTSGGG